MLKMHILLSIHGNLGAEIDTGAVVFLCILHNGAIFLEPGLPVNLLSGNNLNRAVT